MRQRGRAAKQGQHQRKEIDLGGPFFAAYALKARVLAGTQHATAGRALLVVNGYLVAIVFHNSLAAPQDDFALL